MAHPTMTPQDTPSRRYAASCNIVRATNDQLQAGGRPWEEIKPMTQGHRATSTCRNGQGWPERHQWPGNTLTTRGKMVLEDRRMPTPKRDAEPMPHLGDGETMNKERSQYRGVMGLGGIGPWAG
jgi:hypothetical protein